MVRTQADASAGARQSRRAARRARRAARRKAAAAAASTLEEVPAEQFAHQSNGRRLVDNLGPLLAVVFTVIFTRANQGEAFLKRARAASETLNLREMADEMPVPRLQSVSQKFCGAAFDAARGVVGTVFDGEVGDVKAFLEQLVERGNAIGEERASNSALLLMVIYLDRLYARCPALMLNPRNAIKLMAAAYTVAVKVLEDVHWGVGGLCRVVGLRWKELCVLEAAFLKLLDYRVNVSAEDFCDAESKFAAEALESDGWKDVLNTLHGAKVTGIEAAIAQAKNWMAVIPPGAPGGVKTLSGLTSATFYSGDRGIWRTRESKDPLTYDQEWTVRRRLLGLALSQYGVDFGHLPLSLGPREEEEAEWQVAGICERSGLERFRKLRSLLLQEDFSAPKLPPMVKRLIPFTMRPWNVEARPEAGFSAALGPSGRFLMRDPKDAVLIPPDPYDEFIEDMEMTDRHPPSPKPLVHQESCKLDVFQDAGVGHSFIGGHRVSDTGSPCTPVGPRGGVVVANPPVFTNPTTFHRVVQPPREASPPPPIIYNPPAPEPVGTQHLANYFVQYARGEVSLDVTAQPPIQPPLQPPEIHHHPQQQMEEEASALLRVRRMQSHFGTLQPGGSLFSSQPFLDGVSQPVHQEVGRTEKRQGQAATGASPTHIMGNVNGRRGGMERRCTATASTAVEGVGLGIGRNMGGQARQPVQQRKRARVPLRDEAFYAANVTRW